MSKLTRFAVLGALALAPLTACSAATADVDFCTATTTLDDQSEALNNLELTDDVFEAAVAGDLGPLNTWGADAGDALDEMSAEIDRVRGSAPDDEVAAAIDVVVEGLGVVGTMASSAEEATDLPTFIAEMESIGNDFEEFETDMDAAMVVLEAADEKYCN